MSNQRRKTPQRSQNKGFQNQVGLFVQDFRRIRGFNQFRLARLAGMSRTNISGIERGAQGISLVQFVTLCAVLDVSPTQALAKILRFAGYPSLPVKGL